MAVPRDLLARLGWWQALTTPGPRRLLGVNGLVDAAGSGLAAIVLPFFAIRVAHLPLVQFAAVLTAGGLVELLVSVPAGTLAARTGIRRYNVAARLGRGAVFAVLPWCDTFPALLALVCAEGAMRSANAGLTQALAVAAVGESRRMETLAVVRTLRNIGYLGSAGLGAVVLAGGSAGLLRAALVANAASFLASARMVARVDLVAGASATPPARTDWSVLRDVTYFGLVLCASVYATSVLILDVGLPLWVLRHDQLPRWTVGLAVGLNTAIVVAAQYRVAGGAATVAGSLRSLRISAGCFVGMAAFVAASQVSRESLAVLAVVAAALLLTCGEMTESPAWWTLSYELSPRHLTSEYLAAFDTNRSLVNVAGPPLVVAAVSAGSGGWLAYAGVMVLAALCAHALTAARLRTHPAAHPETHPETHARNSGSEREAGVP